MLKWYGGMTTDGAWRGTLDRSRSHIAYPVGTKDAAQALADRLNLGLAEDNQKDVVEGSARSASNDGRK